jgi:hypothetical protein
MAKTLTIRVSSGAIGRLDALCKSSDLKRGSALSWIVAETSRPSIPKRGKATRSEPLSLPISDEAQSTLDAVVAANESNMSMVVEAYLARDY